MTNQASSIRQTWKLDWRHARHELQSIGDQIYEAKAFFLGQRVVRCALRHPSMGYGGVVITHARGDYFLWDRARGHFQNSAFLDINSRKKGWRDGSLSIAGPIGRLP